MTLIAVLLFVIILILSPLLRLLTAIVVVYGTVASISALAAGYLFFQLTHSLEISLWCALFGAVTGVVMLIDYYNPEKAHTRQIEENKRKMNPFNQNVLPSNYVKPIIQKNEVDDIRALYEAALAEYNRGNIDKTIEEWQAKFPHGMPVESDFKKKDKQ